MLRHYDKLGLLAPCEIDDWSGYRYYTIEQLPRLNRIVALNGMGFTLQQVGDLLVESEALSVDRLRGMLMVRQAELEQELRHKQMQIASVEARLSQIELEERPIPYETVVKSLDSIAVASVQQVVPKIDEVGYYCDRLYARLYKTLDKLAIPALVPELTLYHSQEYTEVDLDMEVAVRVDQDVIDEGIRDAFVRFTDLPRADSAAAIVFEGHFEEVPAAILALLGWVGTQGMVPTGPLREIHLSGPAHIDGILQEPAILELQIPVSEAS